MNALKTMTSTEPATDTRAKGRPCLSCVESGQHAKHDAGCRDDSAHRNKSIQWVKAMDRLLHPKRPHPWAGFSFMPGGNVE